jgi:2,4-dienoyl-CoA reductase-like NADH-dependent reductase (Old Yellow Enzyme family)
MSTLGLFTPLTLRSVTFRNRIGVSPMCQYSSHDGFASDWHLVHLGSRAVGGAGMVMAEATAVTADGRISPQDLGIWSDAHIEGLARCARFIEDQGAVAAIQLAHAGRKASTPAPWHEGKVLTEEDGGWRPIWAPSSIPFSPDYPTPSELDKARIAEIIGAFARAAGRAFDAGFRALEIHAAHGYLLHEFLSPLSNRRDDEYGGSFDNRTRIVRETVEAVRVVWPEELPLFIRISATDWTEGGWDADQSVELARQLKPLGIDFVDCSTGGLVPSARIPLSPGYQVPFAERIRKETGLATAAVGLIREPAQAQEIIQSEQADMVLLAREMLRDPYWPQHSARFLEAAAPRPIQYGRAAD